MKGRLWIIAAVCSVAVDASSAPLPRIALIIDDLGYQLDAGRRAIALPGPVVCAILPGAPRADALARTAH